ncbi:hypothetical protein [Papillibacter cinnamivorans]|uniref:Uncharacterized protein n=1 Tax=Papillibacter cinnamivorans DSM 12816 TaxID=1122930 RepID=A0A1W1YP50_9FIRM|nr:hypothetical protein [Papillibacter cinnamivorans]SMC37913.1 hypothetical protein SAMN02745168_0575 [Papillibacter cinnamivorans DSM 12816]
MKVGVKFCGHCAMHMDMTVLYGALRLALPEIEFAYASASEKWDLLLILNACPVACAGRPVFDGPVITVSPVAVDGWPVEPENLLEELAKRLKNAENRY